jgi:hypothetical protein
MLLDKAVPSLQAIEQTNLSLSDQLSEEEIGEMIRAHITAQPTLLMSALDSDAGLRAAVLAHITRKPSVVEAIGSVPQEHVA